MQERAVEVNSTEVHTSDQASRWLDNGHYTTKIYEYILSQLQRSETEMDTN
jgi:hypothetical protein